MIVVDVETTGLNPEKHRIVSIGAIDFFSPERQFYLECQVPEGVECTQESFQVNGFSPESLRDSNKKTEAEMIESFLAWIENIEDKTLAGHNTSFDRNFLRVALERCGSDFRLGYRTVDLHTICYIHYFKRGLKPPIKNGRTDINSDTIFVYVGLPEEEALHHALKGAKLEAEALSRLIFGKELLDEFSKYPLPDYLKQ